MKRMTHDHSWVQSLIDDGRITPEEAAVHPHRSLLLKVLNGQPQHIPDTQIVDLRLGDRILFCSDGLCGLVNDDTIGEHLNTTNLDDVVDLLTTDAHAGGGTDNITIVVAEVVEADPNLDASEPSLAQQRPAKYPSMRSPPHCPSINRHPRQTMTASQPYCSTPRLKSRCATPPLTP